MLAVQGSEGISAEEPAKPLDANDEEDTLTVRATLFPFELAR